MPLQKLLFKPGVNRENTRYTSEGGWYDGDKIRFRQGTPEKIGGWVQWAAAQFLGICRNLIGWTTLASVTYVGIGTNLKFYLGLGGVFYDITPLRSTTGAGDVTFAATDGSAVLVVSDTAHGALTNDFVTFSDAVSLGGDITAEVLNKEYQITFILNSNSYTITASVAANASDAGDGGAATVGAYQLNTGSEFETPFSGWGAGAWGSGDWGIGGTSTYPIGLWNSANFGEDLIYGTRNGGIYYWDATSGPTTRGVNVASLGGASDVPVVQTALLVSDVSRFVLCFGVNALGTSTLDPMLVRWSDQEDVANWTPTATNQAGDLRLSNGSRIVTARPQRQEILVWTDSALYSLQYLGPPFVWGAQSVGENISIISSNAVATANNITYWMGADKFYMYDGRVQTLPCDLRQFIFQNADADLTLNPLQADQIFASTVEAYNEIWWFYCSSVDATLSTPDRYVVFNYAEGAWYYGTLNRSAWLDSKILSKPLAATSNKRLAVHETGVDDVETGEAIALPAYITSAEFDMDDGHNMSFVWRLLPDITFRGSTADNPTATFTLYPQKNSGSGITDPASVGGNNAAGVVRTATVPVEQFTGQVYTRVRGRQLSIKVESDSLGTTWQLGAPRIDIRPDGRR